MIYKVLNKLFGIHFVVIKLNGKFQVKRVKTDPNGSKYVTTYDCDHRLYNDGTVDTAKGMYEPITFKLKQKGSGE